MTAAGSSDEKLEQLLEQLFIDGLAPEACDQLQSILAADLDAQRRYAQVVHMREGLAYLLSQTPVDPPAPASPGSLPPASDPPLPSAVEQGRTPPGLRHLLPSWAVAASIFIGIGLASALAYHLGARGQRLAAIDPQLKMRPVAATPFAQTNYLGKVSGLSLDASADGLLKSMQVGQELRCGEVVQLSSGFIRIELNSGSRLIIEGPAEFSLVGDNRVFVRSGRLAAAEGPLLVVQTPLVTAECREAGASFDIDGDDAARVYAESGVVTLYATPYEDAVSYQLAVLRAGEGLLVNPGGKSGALATASAGPIAAVIDSWDQVESRLRPYARLVLADRPIAYWPLYQVRKNRRVLDLTQNGHDGLPIGNWPDEFDRRQTDESGRGVYFNGECYIEPDRKPPIKFDSGFAIEGWARPEGNPQYQAIFTSRWVRGSHTPNQQGFGVTLYAGDVDRWEFWTGNGRPGQLWNVMESPEPIDRKAWTHVVGVFTPTESTAPGYIKGVARLYVNGEPAIEAEHEVSLTDFDWPARIGAAEYVPRYLTSWLFKGYLSDIAVYGYPLEPARIEAHYELGKSDAGYDAASFGFADGTMLASTRKEGDHDRTIPASQL